MRLNRSKIVILGCFWLLSQWEVRAQPEMMRPVDMGTPLFYFDVLSYRSDSGDLGRVDIYIQVPYDNLRFIRGGGEFIARYEVVFVLFRQGNEVALERSWNNSVKVTDFSLTTQKSLAHLSQRSLELKAGDYTYKIKVRDLESGKEGEAERPLKIPNFYNVSISSSDIMLVSRATREGGNLSIVPNISRLVHHSPEGFFFFLEGYSTLKSDSLRVSWRILDRKNSPLIDTTKLIAKGDVKTDILLHVRDVNLPIGNYTIFIDITPAEAGADKRVRSSSSRNFVVRWTDIPYSITNLDKAIEQLRYIAAGEEITHVRGGTSEEDKRDRFVEFWKKRDPNPSTPRNELMEEYYRRIEYVNQTFGHYSEGWKTDRGMVYIRFGPPESVERHPFDTDTKPYEIWYYYQQNRQFVFVDESGFGDYRLRYPNTDLWGRTR